MFREDKMTTWVLVMMMFYLSNGDVKRCSVQKSVTVSKLSKAIISCPPVSANHSDVKYLLNFNGSNISQIQLNKQSDSAKSLFSGQFEVTANSSGVYSCVCNVIYPPPFRDDCHSTEVTVAEMQFLPKINDTAPEANQSCQVRSPFIPNMVMWVGCSILSVYSLSITCLTTHLWRKLKRDDDDDDTNLYMNTRPADLKKPSKV